MNCPVMVRLINKLDEERSAQCKASGNLDVILKKKRLAVIEGFLNRHKVMCEICRNADSYIHVNEGWDSR